MLFERALSRLVNNPALEEDVDEEDREEREDRRGEDETLVGAVLCLKPNKK